MTKPTKTALPRVLLILLLSQVLVGSVLAAEPPRPRQGARYIYLIRHGIYDRVDSLDDRTANGLNALGRRASTTARRALKTLPVRPRILVTSGLRRARETGDEMASILNLPVARDSVMRSMCRSQRLWPR